MKFFGCQGFFFVNFDFKNECKNEFLDNMKNRAADSKIGHPKKLILEPFGLTSPTRQSGS